MVKSSQNGFGGDFTDKNHWQEAAEKIYKKVCRVARSSAGKIPYSTVGGRFDDRSEDICWWTNGFWAGELWQLWGAFGGDELKSIAEEIEKKLDSVFLKPWGMDHDSGFRWLMTAGASYRLTGSEESKNRLILAANDLAGRFNLAGRFIRAWNDSGDGSRAGWAIIDCMMNLPLLYTVSDLICDPRFAQIAEAHADTSVSAFLRPDGSLCHIVEFDPISGRRLKSHGGQGYAHGSSWTRGQAWGLYGFTLSYIHAKKPEYLETAVKIADRFISRIPENKLIPVDFDQPVEPWYEDSTASAIAACGLIELSKFAGRKYLEAAESLLEALTESRCRFDCGCDNILEKCTAAYHDSQHEGAIIYGDYFYTEAVLKLCGKETFLW